MKTQKRIVGSMILACGFGIAGLAGAQPPAAGGAGTNPPNQQPGGNRGNWQNMTPEQRQQMIGQFMERRLRNELTQAGFTDTATQDAIVEFSRAMETLRAPLRDQANKLRDAVANKTADAEVTPLINDLRAATATAKQQREDAIKALDAKISYTTKPRLEAFLIAGGYIGDEMSFSGGMGGRGGFGGGGFGGGGFGQGGFGGRGGGQGGQGGRRGGRGGNNNQ